MEAYREDEIEAMQAIFRDDHSLDDVFPRPGRGCLSVTLYDSRTSIKSTPNTNDYVRKFNNTVSSVDSTHRYHRTILKFVKRLYYHT